MSAFKSPVEVVVDQSTYTPEELDNEMSQNAQEFMRAYSKQAATNDFGAGVQGSSLANLEGEVTQRQISWNNLSYHVLIGRPFKQKTQKRILINQSGWARPGSILAIMGPTGCGKTSLLNALAGRLPKGGQLSGEININSKPRTPNFRSYTAYVMQDDIMFSTLTVKETFIIAAVLRLPRSTSRAEKHQVVEQLILELGLRKAQDTRIGNEYIRGVSGGERKRVNVGVQMISNPSILFLDEPTSGLDSFQALSVMDSLNTLAAAGRTLVCTIHQPRSSIFGLFSHLLLLSEGKQIYFGRATQAAEWFKSSGFGVPANFNPADYFMDVISMDYRTKELEDSSRKRVNLLSENYHARAASGHAPISDLKPSSVPEDPNARVHFASNWFMQFGTLYWRANKQVFGDYIALMVPTIQSIFLSILLGLIYSDVTTNQKGVQDYQGVLFFIAINTIFSQLFGIITTFPIEKGIIMRERAGKMYRVSAYYVAKVLSECPVRLLPALLYGIIVYWFIGLEGKFVKFLIFLGVLILEGLAAQGIAFFASAVARDQNMALALSPMIVIVLMLFGGFFVNLESLPTGSEWVSYVSPIRWAFMGIAINQFEDLEFSCDCSGLEGKRKVLCEQKCVPNGEVVLENLGFTDSRIWHGCVGLVGVTVLFHIFAFIALKLLGKMRFQDIEGVKGEKKK